jgi:hypothetical protein
MQKEDGYAIRVTHLFQIELVPPSYVQPLGFIGLDRGI